MNEQKREKKSLKRARGTGHIYRQKKTSRYTIQFYQRGKLIRIATRTDDYDEARRQLNARLVQKDEGQLINLKAERAKVSELAQLLFDDYTNKDNKSLEDVKRKWRLHIGPYFADLKVAHVNFATFEAYKPRRKQLGVSPSSINRELAFLKRAFNLGYKACIVRHLPSIEMLRESPPREGFLEDDQYQRLAAETTKVGGLWFRAWFETACTFAWRHSEVLNLHVRQVDLQNRTIRLAAGTTKNRDARLVVMPDLVYTLIAQCVSGKQPDDYVFTREDGSSIKEIRVLWYKASSAAGTGKMICKDCGYVVVCGESPEWRPCPKCKNTVDDLRYQGLIIHDLRRSGARNMIRRGIPERVAMKIGRWRTRSMLDRYHVVSETDLRDAAYKMDQPLSALNKHNFEHNRDFESDGAKTQQTERPN